MVREREDIVGLDSAILMHPMVWRESGHVANFADPMIDCKKCKKRYRVDEIDPEYENTGIAPTVCPDPKCKGELTPARKFNLMFETHLGPVADSAAKTYLRPETAQGIFANFINVTDSTRIKVPDSEQEHLARELSNILDWIAQLDEVATDGVEPMASVADMRLPVREDEVTGGNMRERILKNAPQEQRGFFVVPKVVE